MNIKDYLELSGKTQSEFAKDLGVSQGLVSKYVNREKFPRQRTANKIYKVTKGAVSFADLYSSAEEQQAA